MIDKAQIEAGIAEMKLLLIIERNQGAVQFLGAYDPSKPDQHVKMANQTEIEGRIDIEELAQAFMRGAGIEPISDVAALQTEVAQLRAEVEELRAAVATMRLVSRPDDGLSPQQRAIRDRFKPLAPRDPED